MEVFYDIFDDPTPQEIEPVHSRIREKKQTERLKVAPKRKIYQISIAEKSQKERCDEKKIYKQK